MNSNLVSVIIPVFNAEKYVEEAIQSVFSQTYKNLELICINDNSSDSSLSILESFEERIILINNKANVGTAEARNRGVRRAQGGFLAFLDNDDIWGKNKLEVQMNHFDTDPLLDGSFSNMQSFLSPELSDEVKNLRYCPPNPMPGFIASTMVVKRTSFERVGYFDARWKSGESIEWLFRAQEAGLNLGLVDDVLVKRRIHETNKGVLASSTSKREYLKIIRESLCRRRKP